MQWLAILILIGVAAWAVFAIRSAKKHRGCGGDCSHCAGCDAKKPTDYEK